MKKTTHQIIYHKFSHCTPALARNGYPNSNNFLWKCTPLVACWPAWHFSDSYILWWLYIHVQLLSEVPSTFRILQFQVKSLCWVLTFPGSKSPKMPVCWKYYLKIFRWNFVQSLYGRWCRIMSVKNFPWCALGIGDQSTPRKAVDAILSYGMC